MGKPAARLGDIGSNHGAWHPTPIVGGSGDVFTNSRPAARVGDPLLPHVKPKSPPHGRSLAAGASHVFINGKPAARVGDAISCGGKVSTGSGDVLIGDSPKLTKPDNVNLPEIVFPGQTGKIPAAMQRKAYEEKKMGKGEEVVVDTVPKATFTFNLSS